MIDARLSDRTMALALRWLAIESGTAALADRLGPDVVAPSPPSAFLPPAAVVCGPAVLLRRERTPDGERRASSYAVVREKARPGSVVLVATELEFGAAFGSGFALEAALSGAQAVLTDGRWRDAGRLELLGLPVGSIGGDPTRPAGCPAVPSEREQLFGLRWSTGDWLVRDRDGVVRLDDETARAIAAELVEAPPADLASLLAAG